MRAVELGTWLLANEWRSSLSRETIQRHLGKSLIIPSSYEHACPPTAARWTMVTPQCPHSEVVRYIGCAVQIRLLLANVVGNYH